MRTLNLNELNSNQLYGSNWNDGPLLVLAGHATGKTSMLVSRTVRLIKDSPSRYWRVLGLSPTAKTAGEMNECVNRQVPHSVLRYNLKTFDSFAEALLRQHGSHIGLCPSYAIVSDKFKRIDMLNEMIRKVLGSFSHISGENLLPVLDRYLESDCDSNVPNFLAVELDLDPNDLDNIFREYRDTMIERNTLDAPSLVVEALGLIRRMEGIRKQMYRAYRYICIDDFQNTNFSQYQLVRELVNRESNNLIVATDDHHVINHWNGPNPNRIEQLKHEFGMETLSLPANYRCPSSIVSVANRLINPNLNCFTATGEVEKIKLGEEHKKSVNVIRFSKFEDEVEWIASNIANRTAEERDKCVVLAKTNKVLDHMIEALKNRSVVGFTWTPRAEFLSTPLQWMHSIFRLANARSNSEHLFKVCKTYYELTGIETNPRDIIPLANSAEGDYLRAWAKTVLRSQISRVDREVIENIVVKLLADHLDHAEFQIKAFKWFYDLSKRTSEDRSWYGEYSEEKKIWNGLVEDVALKLGRRQFSLHRLVTELDLRFKTPKPPKGAIPCLTVHASQVMECDHVYLIGMVEDQFPSRMSIEKGNNSSEMEEERRSCFVAITRAQESIHLTFSDEVNNRPKDPSRFLSEMGVLNEAVRPSDCEVGIQDKVVHERTESYRMAR